jgi:methylmalonyl-CoA/ethylmalonyl-CoA epimerase
MSHIRLQAPPTSLHHVGVAVSDLDQALVFYQAAFAFELVSGPFVDPIQKVRVCFLKNHGDRGALLELICPAEPDSPVTRFLTKGVGAYHVCYEVSDLESTLDHMRSAGCLVLGAPQPAVAFMGRKIAWCFLPTKQLVEFVESRLSDSDSPAVGSQLPQE